MIVQLKAKFFFRFRASVVTLRACPKQVDYMCLIVESWQQCRGLPYVQGPAGSPFQANQAKCVAYQGDNHSNMCCSGPIAAPTWL